jgi:type IV pilus assembly protein PilF
MNPKKGLILGVLLLTACSSADKKNSDLHSDANKLHRLAQMQTVDHEKAAKLNIELGLRYYRQGQIARAKSKFTRALKLAPNLPEVHYSYAFFLEQMGEVDNAKIEYEKSIRLDPTSGIARNNYGTFLCRQGKYEESLAAFDLATEDQNYSRSAEAMENAGLCALKYNDVARATTYFQRAVRHDQNRTDALLELAIINFNQNKIMEARSLYRQFDDISKPTARSLGLGIELAKLDGDKNRQSSLELLLKAQYPDNNGSRSNRS